MLNLGLHGFEGLRGALSALATALRNFVAGRQAMMELPVASHPHCTLGCGAHCPHCGEGPAAECKVEGCTATDACAGCELST